MRSREAGPGDLLVVAPNGRGVWICAVPRGYTLREVTDGSGQISGQIAEGAIHALQWAIAQTSTRWVVGVLSEDTEAWGGQRRFYCAYVDDAQLADHLQMVADQVTSGMIPVPLPRDWRFRRRPIKSKISNY